ncbi:MAG: LPS assembly protein LptD, partial [Opitutaceae bacterium]
SVQAQTPASGRLRLQAPKQETTFDGDTVASGGITIGDGDVLITASELTGNLLRGPVTLTGNVVLTRRTIRLLADRLTYNQRDGSFSAERVRLGSDPYYVEGSSASGTRTEITITQAKVTYGEPGLLQPTLSADSFTVSTDKRVRSENALVGIGSARALPIPKFEHNLAAPFIPFADLNGGYRSSLGVFLEAGVQVPLSSQWRIGGDLGVYTSRGIMAGPSLAYGNPTGGSNARGSFRSGYIQDHGDRETDVLGRAVPVERAFLEWQHEQKLAENLTLNAQLNWWKDSEVVRDFRSRAFFRVQEPDTFVESVYAGKNYFVSAFARFQPNTFHRVQERLPEVRFDLLPLAVGGGFYERFEASAAVLREDPPLGGPRLRSDRLDAYYALARPIAPAEWLSLTPIAGGRITHYANTVGALRKGSYTRLLGEIGLDASLRASGTFAYKNERWKIDGLRHLVTPRLSYRYIPEGGKGLDRIPAIDRRARLDRTDYLPYLQPLGLGEQRNLDDLRRTNTLRLGIDNILQTRDPAHGSRDLAVFDVATDLRFQRQPGEREFSEVHTDLALMPTSWLQLDLYQSFTPRTMSLRELNTGLTLRDGREWSVRFSNNFLRDELHDYAIDGRLRINEAFEFLTRLHYDVRKRRFNEQAYGLSQNLGNTWLLSYIVTLYSGPRRESHFGLRIQIDTVRF